MSQKKITQLTSEQEALLSVSIEPINRDRATKAIESIYAVMEWGEQDRS